MLLASGIILVGIAAVLLVALLHRFIPIDDEEPGPQFLPVIVGFIFGWIVGSLVVSVVGSTLYALVALAAMGGLLYMCTQQYAPDKELGYSPVPTVAGVNGLMKPEFLRENVF